MNIATPKAKPDSARRVSSLIVWRLEAHVFTGGVVGDGPDNVRRVRRHGKSALGTVGRKADTTTGNRHGMANTIRDTVDVEVEPPVWMVLVIVF